MKKLAALLSSAILTGCVNINSSRDNIYTTITYAPQTSLEIEVSTNTQLSSDIFTTPWNINSKPSPPEKRQTQTSSKQNLENKVKNKKTSLKNPLIDNSRGIGEISGDDFNYNLTRAVINGEEFYRERNIFRKEGEADFFLVKKEYHSKQYDEENNLITIHSPVIYIPTLLGTPDKELLNYLKLNPQGQFGIKAERTPSNTQNIVARVLDETEEDSKFEIPTVPIRSEYGNQWIAPVVEPPELERLKVLEKFDELTQEYTLFPDSLPFYLVPARDTDPIINDNGKISLLSRQGIFRPILTKKENYLRRRNN